VVTVSISAIALGQTGESAPVSPVDRIVQFERDVAPILKERCLSCHQGDAAKNGFVVSDREAMLGFIEPGNAAGSSLWTDYLRQPPKAQVADSLVMPPNGPLSINELSVLKIWIDEGADWPENATVGLRTANTALADSARSSMLDKTYRALGYFHPAIVHFPIALFLVGGAIAFLSYFLGPRCATTAFQCLVVAALTSILTVVMGWSLAATKGYPPWNQMLAGDATHEEMTLFFHRWMGTGIAMIGVLAVIVGLFARKYKSHSLTNVWRITAIALALLVSWVGHQGGELVYGEIIDRAIEEFRK
jgi:uncharacterized membrane protein